MVLLVMKKINTLWIEQASAKPHQNAFKMGHAIDDADMFFEYFFQKNEGGSDFLDSFL